MLNRITVFVCFWCLLFSVTVFATPIDSVEQNGDTEEITVNGTLANVKKLTVQILKPNISSNQLASVTNDNASSIIQNIKQFNIETNNYNIVIGMGRNAVTGTYLIRINGDGMESLYEMPFDYYNLSKVEDVFDNLIASSEKDIYTILSEEINLKILGVNAQLFTDFPVQTKEKLVGLIYQNKEKITNVTQFREYFLQQCILLAITNAKDGTAAGEVLKTYNTQLGINTSTKYEIFCAFPDEIQSEVGARFIGESLKDLDALKVFFNKAIVLGEIQNAAGSMDVHSILLENKSLFDTNDLKAYFDLADTYKVDADIAGENFKSFVLLVKKINSIIDENKGGSSPQGGGGGGGSGTTMKVVTAPISNEETRRFNDLDTAEWAKTSVEYLANAAIIAGRGDGKFYPHETVTREEFVKMLVLAFDINTEEVQMPFEDIDRNGWYYFYVASAYQTGLVKGISDNLFGIGESITRQDVAVLVWRFMSRVSAALPAGTIVAFTDKTEIDEYAREPVASLRIAGVINGMSDGTFRPTEVCTRAQAANIIYAALDYTGLVKGGN